MSETKVQEREKSEEIIQVEKLIYKGNYEEALDLIKTLLNKGESNLYDIVSCNLLKCEIFFQQGLYNNVIKIAQQTYEESQDLGSNFLSIDALIEMAKSLIRLNELEKGIDILKKGEDLLTTIKEESTTEYMQRKASLSFIKGNYYRPDWGTNDIDKALEQYEYSLELRKKLDNKKEIANSLSRIAFITGVYKGEIERSLKYMKQSLSLAEKSANKYDLAEIFNIYGMIYGLKGDFNIAIPFFNQSLIIFKKLNNKPRKAAILNNLSHNYRMIGELDHSLECIEESLIIFKNMGVLFNVAQIYDFFIQIVIEKGELDRAQQALYELKELRDHLKNKTIDVLYLVDKALVLKNSSQVSDRDKAEEIFKQLLKEKDFLVENTLITLLSLCELLLIKLSNNTNLNVLDELLVYVNQIKNVAKNWESYWLLAETYFLQAELERLTLDLAAAKESLAEAQIIAKQKGLNQLNEKILRAQEKLLEQTQKWVSLKNSTKNVIELSNLTPLKEQIQYMLKKREMLKKFFT